MREATALVERVELVRRSPSAGSSADGPSDDVIVAGFRADGALSLFFGQSPVYQFNAAGELRRAFRRGLLFKAVGGKLVSLRRERNDRETQLLRHELSDAEQDNFLIEMRTRLNDFAQSLAANDIRIQRQFPTNADVLDRLRAWFNSHTNWLIADRPNV